MSAATRHLQAMRDAAIDLLLESGAIQECEMDAGIYVDQHRGTGGARDLGLKLIKVNDRRVSIFKNRQDLSTAIDAAFEEAEERCPLCAARATHQ